MTEGILRPKRRFSILRFLVGVPAGGSGVSNVSRWRQLRWLTIFAPALFVGVFELLREHYLDFYLSQWFGWNYLLWVGIGIVLIGVGGAAYLFSRLVFGVIEEADSQIVKRNQELSAVNSVSLAVSQSPELNVVLSQALSKVLEVTGAEVGEILLKEEETQELVLCIHMGPFAEVFRERTRFKLGEGFPGLVAETGEVMVTKDPRHDPRFVRQGMKPIDFAFFAGVPLKSSRRVVGVMDIASRSAAKFPPEEIHLLEAIGHQIGTAVEKAWLLSRVEALATLEERQRISREMHDELAQVLGYVNTKVQAALEYLDAGQMDEAKDQLQDLDEQAREVYGDLREAILGLRLTLSDGQGLWPALQEYLERFTQRTGIQAEFSRPVQDQIPSISRAAELQMLRIVQEALSNIRKHSLATTARVEVTASAGVLKVTVTDNGQGFDLSGTSRATSQHVGLQVMRERAQVAGGHLDIRSEMGGGTQVVIYVPVNHNPWERRADEDSDSGRSSPLP
ncbi:MAG: GAF domain-containing protein [Chloroflexi bacterium]|nr:GAF domain-containing protein [Chloroflexota bacterium]